MNDRDQGSSPARFFYGKMTTENFFTNKVKLFNNIVEVIISKPIMIIKSWFIRAKKYGVIM